MVMFSVAEMRATHETSRVCCPGPHEALHADQSLDCHLAEIKVEVKINDKWPLGVMPPASRSVYIMKTRWSHYDLKVLSGRYLFQSDCEVKYSCNLMIIMMIIIHF